MVDRGIGLVFIDLNFFLISSVTYFLSVSPRLHLIRNVLSSEGLISNSDSLVSSVDGFSLCQVVRVDVERGRGFQDSRERVDSICFEDFPLNYHSIRSSGVSVLSDRI